MQYKSYLWIEYPKCSTCKRAKGVLEKCAISYVDRDIKTQNPTYEELKEWSLKYSVPVQKFFNTSGLLYREMHLKEKLKTMNEEEMLHLLSTDGMLVKRPLLITDEKILIGFKKEEYLSL